MKYRTPFSVTADERDIRLMCSLYSMDSYKRDNILLETYKEESRRSFTNILSDSMEIGDQNA